MHADVTVVMSKPAGSDGNATPFSIAHMLARLEACARCSVGVVMHDILNSPMNPVDRPFNRNAN
jgi:hypothetical protein